MSDDLVLLIRGLERVRLRLSADHLLAQFVNSQPSEAELEIAATHFAAWFQRDGNESHSGRQVSRELRPNILSQ
jgi:hypothetical protein